MVIRMIYIGTKAPTESTKVVMTGEGTQISTGKFNSSYDKAEYVGYQLQMVSNTVMENVMEQVKVVQ